VARPRPGVACHSLPAFSWWPTSSQTWHFGSERSTIRLSELIPDLGKPSETELPTDAGQLADGCTGPLIPPVAEVLPEEVKSCVAADVVTQTGMLCETLRVTETELKAAFEGSSYTIIADAHFARRAFGELSVRAGESVFIVGAPICDWMYAINQGLVHEEGWNLAAAIDLGVSYGLLGPVEPRELEELDVVKQPSAENSAYGCTELETSPIAEQPSDVESRSVAKPLASDTKESLTAAVSSSRPGRPSSGPSDPTTYETCAASSAQASSTCVVEG